MCHHADLFDRLSTYQYFLYLFSIWRKRYTNFGQKHVIGGEIGEIIKLAMDMYIYILDQEENGKLFRKISVRLSLRPQNLCTLKLENG